MDKLVRDRSDSRVLLLAPTAKDAATTERILSSVGIASHVCKSMDEVCGEYLNGAGAVLLTEEAIVSGEGDKLMALVRQQPAWSDFPIVILTRGDLKQRRPSRALEAIEHRTLISRPVEIAILISTLQAALRDRRRQYALRNYLVERERTELALLEADRRKDEFLAMLAHELRNPLAALQSAAELLRLPGAGDVDRVWAQDVIARQLTQLTRLMDDLLDVSRVTQGKILLRTERLQVGTIVRRAVDAVRPIMQMLNHRLEVISAESAAWVEGDPVRLEQVVVNLLNNAAKYTREGGCITLLTEVKDGSVYIRIKDTGIGISPENLSRVFELFRQADRALDRSQGGLGIGLTLVKKLVEMHSGEISATSAGEGRGSEFVVRLPAAREAPKIVPRLQPNSTGQPGKRVLIVDDNQDAGQALAMLLRLAGHQPTVVKDGMAALHVAHEVEPQVALLDIGMPDMDGYELVRRLRESGGWPGTLYVAVSGYGQPQDQQRSLEAGFDHHLVKPVDHQQLLGLIAGVGDC